MTEPSKDDVQAASASRASNGYLLLGFACTFLPAPFNVTALIPLLLSVLGSVRASRALRRLHAPRPIQVSNNVGLGLTILLMATVALPLLMPSHSAFDDCMAGANTHVAQQSCRDQFHRSGDVWTTLFG